MVCFSINSKVDYYTSNRTTFSLHRVPSWELGLIPNERHARRLFNGELQEYILNCFSMQSIYMEGEILTHGAGARDND